MKIKSNEIKKNNLRTGKLFLISGLFLVWFFVFGGVALAKDGRILNPPTIMSHTPGIDAGQVSINGAISVVWDRPMRLDTDFIVTGPEGFLGGTFLYDPNSFTVTFLPDNNLSAATRYGVLVAGQTDMNGMVQQQAYQWNFSTVSPTSVSIVSLSSIDEGLWQSWWWLSWPMLMAVVSILSLSGFIAVWSRRRLVTPQEKYEGQN